MVGADEFAIGFVALGFVANTRTPVATDVEQGAYLAIGVAGDDDRFTAQLQGKKIAWPGDHAAVAYAVPMRQ